MIEVSALLASCLAIVAGVRMLIKEFIGLKSDIKHIRGKVEHVQPARKPGEERRKNPPPPPPTPAQIPPTPPPDTQSDDAQKV